jgi:tRNA A-37 threonylcarbamoyl transferase component Bud32
MAAATKPIGAPNPRDESDPLLGAVINGKFRIVGVVAAGGMGKIYRAEQLPLGRPVAIKVLHARYTRSEQDPAFQKRFFLEASILSKLQHPNIVTVFDYGRIEEAEEEAYFMAMEYLPGETLHRRLKAHGPLSTGDALALARQIARGLREAHRHGVVHRDLKPSNVMLVPEDDGAENLKILDFGLVKVLADDSEELTKEGSFLGSPRYMSPEQIAHGRVDLRTDVYSLGVILYQCLTGRTPFEGDNSVHILMAHLQMPVPSLREKNPSVFVAPQVEALVMRCLAKEPDGRPRSMDELLQALRECEVALGLSLGPTTTGAFAGAAMGAAVAGALRANAATAEARAAEAFDAADASSLRGRSAPGSFGDSVPSALSGGNRTEGGRMPLAAQPTSPSRTPLVLAGLGVLLLGALGLVALRGRAANTEVATATGSAPVAREYRLVIDAEPAGAAVFEGDALLGQAPFTLLVDNETVRTRPRRLEVRHPGYAPFPVSVGPSPDPSVRLVATLTALAAETDTPAAAPTPRAPEPPAPPAAPSAHSPVVARDPSPGRPARPRTPRPAQPGPSPLDDIRSHR